MIIRFKKLHPEAKLPVAAYERASGFDLITHEDILIQPGQIYSVNTGLQLADVSDPDVEIQIRPRSSLAKNWMIIPNSPATIDNDYRGEIIVLLLNLGKSVYRIKEGDKYAQLVISRVIRGVEFQLTEEVSKTERGAKGFGSSDEG